MEIVVDDICDMHALKQQVILSEGDRQPGFGVVHMPPAGQIGAVDFDIQGRESIAGAIVAGPEPDQSAPIDFSFLTMRSEGSPVTGIL
jgi:hypothetical protein